MTSETILAELNDLNPEAVLFDNMHTALVGIGRIGTADPVAVYSQQLIFRKLLLDGFSREDAKEYFAGKLISVASGTNTPVIICDFTEE
ncbi:hypothetical protein EBZ39_04390 [bacterium]|nr:hypothetical protein [bacterium]